MKIKVLFASLIFFASISAPVWAGITATAKIDKPALLEGEEQSVVVKLGIIGAGALAEKERLPLNIAIVIDKSGSMQSQDKIENAKRGALEALSNLSAKDILSIVVYDTEARVIYPAQNYIEPDAVREKILSITANGSTALYDGACFAASEIRKNRIEGMPARIILLSDGLANVGPSHIEDFRSLAESFRSEDITVTTIGLGLDYNEDLMTAFARESDGNTYFVRSSDDLPQVFAEEIHDATSLIAKDITIEFTGCEDVAISGFVGRRGAVEGQTAKVQLSNLYGNTEKYALIELKVPAQSSLDPLKLGEVKVSYTDAESGKASSCSRDVIVEFTASPSVVEEKKDASVCREVLLNRTAEMKTQAIHLADQGKAQEAARILDSASNMLKSDAFLYYNDEKVRSEAEGLKVKSEELEKDKVMTKGARKSLMNESYIQQNQQRYKSK